jgi:hypothetical protein
VAGAGRIGAAVGNGTGFAAPVTLSATAAAFGVELRDLEGDGGAHGGELVAEQLAVVQEHAAAVAAAAEAGVEQRDGLVRVGLVDEAWEVRVLAAVEHGEALGIQHAEGAFHVHHLMARGGVGAHVQAGGFGDQHGAVIPVEGDVAGEVEAVGLLFVDAALGLDHEPFA